MNVQECVTEVRVSLPRERTEESECITTNNLLNMAVISCSVTGPRRGEPCNHARLGRLSCARE
jgi:hypothetical protein